MFTTRNAVAAALAVALLAGCDPYNAENKASPQVLRVLAIGGDAAIEATAPTTAGGAWTLAGVTGSTGISVQTNQLLDGTSIQATPADCTPATGAFTFGGTPGAGTWFACYVPNTANPDDQGGSVLFFNGTNATRPANGEMPAGPFTIRGTIRDRSGNPVTIAVDATP